MNVRILASFLILLILSTTLSGCNRADAQAKLVVEAEKLKNDPVVVETGRVIQGDITATYAGTATLEAEHETKVVAEVGGVVLALEAEEGQVVRKGQLLARLDADRARLLLRQAEAMRQRSAHADERNERLMQKQLISRNAYEENKSDLATRAVEVDLARLTLSKSAIVAPFDGVVTRRWVKQGQLLKANDPAYEVADFRDLKARLRVPERASIAIRPGQVVHFRADVFSDKNFEARVERVSPVVDAKSGTVEILVAVDNRSGKLRPGLFCRLDVAYDTVTAALLVPKAAVMTDTGASSVFVVQEGKVHKVTVELGYESGSQVQVLSGLTSGAEVVVAGHNALAEGTAVQPLKLAVAVAAVNVPKS